MHYLRKLLFWDLPDGQRRVRLDIPRKKFFFKPCHVVPLAAFITCRAVYTQPSEAQGFVQPFAFGVWNCHTAVNIFNSLEL